MNLSKKVIYLLLLTLLILGIVLRYPLQNHQSGSDSFWYGTLSNDLSKEGYITWLISPLSLFGLYPCSQEVSPIFLMSGISQCTCLEMEYTVLLAMMILGSFSILTAFVLFRQIMKNNLFSFIAAAVYSGSRYLVRGTSWTFDTRTLFMIFFPLFLFVLMKSCKQKHNRMEYIILSITFFFLLISTHLIWILFFLIVIAYFLSLGIFKAIRKHQIKFKSKYFVFLYLGGLILFLLITTLGITLYPSSSKPYVHGYFFQGDEPYIVLMNIGIELAMNTGILIVLVPIGIIFAILKKNKNSSDLFCLILPFFVIPFILDPTYVPVMAVFVICIFIALGFSNLLKNLNNIKIFKNLAFIFTISILLFSTLLPSFITVRSMEELHPMEYAGHSSEISYDTYNAALFVKAYLFNGTFVCNDYIMNRKINYISEKPTINEGAIVDIIYGFKSKESLSVIKIDFSLREFIEHKGQIYFLEGTTVKNDYHQMINYDYKQWYGEIYSKQYGVRFVIVNNHIKGIVKFGGRHIESPFYLSVMGDMYKIYDSELESIWYLSN